MVIDFIGNTYDGRASEDVCNGVFITCPDHSCSEVNCNLQCGTLTCTPKNYVKNTGIYDDEDEEENEEDE